MSDAKPAVKVIKATKSEGTAKVVRVVKAAAAPTEPIRLNKRMADLGLCSRREADVWIDNGWVKVNGEIALMGTKVLPQDRVEVDKRAAAAQSNQVTILLNKPIGYVSGQAEDGHQPAVVLIASGAHWQGDSSRLRFTRDQLRGLAPAGRLDIDSTGILVLTQDGRIARQLIGEDSDMEKEYLVRVIIGSKAGPPQANVQAAFPLEKLNALRFGLSLDGQPLKRAQVDWQNPEQLRFILKEGKKRQIRRMCEAVGLYVTGLKRVRIGNVKLGQLPLGQWRYLAPEERF
jgi:23S rRNA pseudouridine2604 synthase